MTDTDCRAYLLGRMNEAEAERFEARLLEDEDAFETLKSVEDDLIDEHARGLMPEAERRQFLARYGHQTDRLAFAGALAQRVPVVERRARVLAFPVRYAAPLAAAAVLLLAVGTLMMRDRASERSAAPAPQASAAPSAAPASTPTVVSLFVLSLGTSRAASAPTAVTIPQSASALNLRVRLNPADRFDRYAMELRANDRAVWRAGDLSAAADAGDLTLSANIPANVLVESTYELAVRGGNEDLGFIVLKVSRTP